MVRNTATDKKIVKALKERTRGLCEICGNVGHDPHHIFGGSRRKSTERIECMAYLCRNCHRLLHDKGYGNRKLKLKSQSELAKMGYSEDEIRKIVGGKLEI